MFRSGPGRRRFRITGLENPTVEQYTRAVRGRDPHVGRRLRFFRARGPRRFLSKPGRRAPAGMRTGFSAVRVDDSR